MRSKVRLLLVAAIACVAAFGGSSAPVQADSLCVRISHTVNPSKFDSIRIHADPACIPLP